MKRRAMVKSKDRPSPCYGHGGDPYCQISRTDNAQAAEDPDVKVELDRRWSYENARSTPPRWRTFSGMSMRSCSLRFDSTSLCGPIQEASSSVIGRVDSN